jgi:hypothetical protein
MYVSIHFSSVIDQIFTLYSLDMKFKVQTKRKEGHMIMSELATRFERALSSLRVRCSILTSITSIVRDPGLEPGLIYDPNVVGRHLPMSLVGTAGFEPATPRPPDECAKPNCATLRNLHSLNLGWRQTRCPHKSLLPVSR